MRRSPCVSPQSSTNEVIFEACEANAMKGMQGEKALNTEGETVEPSGVHEEAAGGELGGGEPEGVHEDAAGNEPREGDVDDGGVGDPEDDPETFRCEPCDADGAEYKVSPDPGEPTASQVEDHRACGHWPYRNWCPECIRGRGGCEQHRRRTEAKKICVFAFDYLMLDESGSVMRHEDVAAGTAIGLKILVAHDSRGKSHFAHVVPQKGVDIDHYAVDVLMKDVAWLGYTQLALRSDNEPAILKLLEHALTEARYTIKELDQVLEEHPNTYDSSGNGQVESAVKQVTAMLRTNKLDLEKRLDKEIPLNSPMLPWLVEYAAFIINARVKGEDGLTAQQRVRKCAFAKRMVPFGELVLVHMPIKSPERRDGGALDSRSKWGIVLGYGRTRHSYVVYCDGTVKEYRSIHRIPLSQRWDLSRIEAVDITPKDVHGGRRSRAVPFTDREALAEEGATAPRRAVRKLELRQADFDPAMGGFGWTEHCPKCTRARLHGWREASNQQHSAGCRQRLEELLAQTERGQARLAHTKERFDRWTAEQRPNGGLLDAASEGEMIAPTNPPEGAAAAEDARAAAAEDAPPEQDAVRRGVAPPPQARVGYRPPGGEDWADMEDGDSIFDDLAGQAAPETPRVLPDSEDTPMEVSHLNALTVVENDPDVKPLMDLIGDEEPAKEDLLQLNVEILRLVAQLGGPVRGYRREREKAVRHLVAEIYSAPRVTRALKMLPDMGLKAGFALDLTNCDENGREWDFTVTAMREKARARVEEEKPQLLIGSPSCTPYSAWQTLNSARHGWPPGELERRRVAGDVHLAFVCELYNLQMAGGRYFLHENPDKATSWERECMQKIMQDERVHRSVGDQCQYGQQSYLGDPVKKPTGWLSNAPEILKAISRRCRGRGGECARRAGGRHATASGRIAREAAVYPFRLCRAILQGCRAQLIKDGKLQDGIFGLQGIFEEDRALYFDQVTGEMLEGEELRAAERVFAVQQQTHESFRDSVTGQPLRADLVRAARKLELEYFEAKGVWERRPRSEALARTGRAPITVRWIDTNKGDDDHPNYRSRLVAREIRRAGENPIFAPTPPLESLRTIISLAATDVKGAKQHVRDPRSEHRTQVSFMDISRAYFCAATDPNDPTYVELPAEDKDHGVSVGLLKKHMYGTRRAADGWHCEYAGRLVDDLGFSVGDASACVFYHKARDLRCSIHGDDLTTVGSKVNLDWFKKELEKHYELKEPHRLGPGPSDDREALVLNRVVRWTDDGLEMEADPRQAEKLLRDLKLDGDGVKVAASPGVKQTRDQLDADAPLERQKATPYRAVVARANYLASDRPELQYSAKEACRWMSSPTETSLNALKRLGRYVAGHRRLVYHYPWQVVDRVDTYSDTDWAGCPKTRKSTSGGCLMLGRHLLKSWSSTQTSIALSSGEAEFYGVVKAGGISLGFQSLLSDIGIKVPIRVWTDSAATLGICGRQGLGRLRHIDTQCLWIQQRVRDGTLKLYKVRGEENPADLFTKHLVCQDRIKNLLQLFGCAYKGGRAATAPKIRADMGTSKGELLRLEELGVDLMEHEGRMFPTTEWDGERVVEALQARPGLLPHQHGDMEERFPKARACDALPDDDPPSHDGLEARGIALGRRGR